MPHLHLLAKQLRTSGERRDVVRHRPTGVTHALADLGGGVALQGQTHDLNPMGQHRPDVLNRTAKWNGCFRVTLSQRLQVAGDGSHVHEEDAIGQVFPRQQRTLAHGLLTEVHDACLTKAGRAFGLHQGVVLCAAMERQADGDLLAIDHRLPGRLVSADCQQGHLARWGRPARRIQERRIDLMDYVQDRLSLERRAVEPLLDRGLKLGVERLARQPPEFLTFRIANRHRLVSFHRNTEVTLAKRWDICQDGRDG